MPLQARMRAAVLANQTGLVGPNAPSYDKTVWIWDPVPDQSAARQPAAAPRREGGHHRLENHRDQLQDSGDSSLRDSGDVDTPGSPELGRALAAE